MNLFIKLCLSIIFVYAFCTDCNLADDGCKRIIQSKYYLCLRHQEADRWLNYGGDGKVCCQGLFLDKCIMDEVRRNNSHCLTEGYQESIGRRWNQDKCKQYNDRNCQDLLNYCEKAKNSAIRKCTDEENVNWPSGELKNECCRSHAIEHCLKSANIKECFGEVESLAHYFGAIRDRPLRRNCVDFDAETCGIGDGFSWLTLILGIILVLIIILIITLLIIFFKRRLN